MTDSHVTKPAEPRQPITRDQAHENAAKVLVQALATPARKAS